MKFELLNFDSRHYASNIFQVDRLLKWDSLGSTHHLIVRSDFGSRIEFTADDSAGIEKQGNDQILSGRETRYADNRFFCLTQKGYVNNYAFTASPAKYAVFCCEYDAAADICRLYVPNEACQYQCDVASYVEIRIIKEPVKKSIFKKPDKEYYIMYIPNIPGYSDGDLRYTFDGCKYRYPVTKAMLDKSIFIPAFNTQGPKVESSSGNGYKIQVQTR